MVGGSCEELVSSGGVAAVVVAEGPAKGSAEVATGDRAKGAAYIKYEDC